METFEMTIPGAAVDNINLHIAKKHERKLRQKIERAHRAGKRKRAEHLTRMYLMSFHARYVATVEANRQLKPHRKVPSQRLPEIAANLDPWQGTKEKVIVHFKPKKSKECEVRPIMDFGIVNRSLQYLVRAALEAQANIHPCQFAIRGGRSTAVKAVMDALTAGNHWVVEIDIADCYPSFDGEILPDLLPIPKEVTRHVLLSRYLNIVLGNVTNCLGPEMNTSVDPEGDLGVYTDVFISEARRGIPQGSAASPIVTDLLLASVVPDMSGNGTVIVYADNFLIMAKEENDVVSNNLALRDALNGHPAGPLRPRFVSETTPQDNMFEFLGFVFRRDGAKITVAPSPKNMATFDYEFNRGLERATRSEYSTAKKHRKLSQLCRYVRSWTASFSPWPDASKFRKQTMAQIENICDQLRTSSEVHPK